MDRNSKIYVAGHNGLVGSAILDLLRNRGYKNLIYRRSSELDLRDAAAVKAFFSSEKPDIVFLAAAYVGGIIANNTYRGEFIYNNLMIQNNVIHQAYKFGVSKLLFLGSTCIYPKDAPQPMNEEYLLTGPLEYTNEPYAIAKIAGIKLCESYNLQFGTNFLSVMPTNLYGPNDNFDLEKSHVLPALMRKLHLGKCLMEEDWAAIQKDFNARPIKGFDGEIEKDEIMTILEKYGIKKTERDVQIEIWGSGKPRREFLWSEDMANACVFIMKHLDFHQTYPKDTIEIRNTHINIGTGKDVSIADLAQILKNYIGFQGSFVFNTDKPDGTFQKLTDVTKLNNLGWKYSCELTTGIEKLYSWYLDRLD